MTLRKALLWLVVLAGGSSGLRAQESALSYTRQQSELGRAAYATQCAMCHGPNLSDGPLGKPLKGPDFMRKYGGHSVRDLFEVTRTTMPSSKPGSLDVATYAALIAFILQENKIVAGREPLPSDSRQLASMVVPGGGFSIMSYSPYVAQKPVVLPNPLEHFTPVGTADLSNPPAQDWLTWRRGWDAHGFSPLAQITPANAASLRLVWSWTLPAGSQEAVPLVRDGTLFMLSFGEIVQAINAQTGDLLWQYTHPLEPGAAPFVKRALALWGDRLYFGTSDVHVVALDARSGALVWDTKMGDFRRHEGLSGGPLVAEGKVMVGTTGTGVAARFGGPQLVGLDATTGKELWRIGTIARPGEPGGDSWNGVLFEARSGASLWTPGSYDPETGLAYFGTGNTYDTGPLLPRKKQPGMSNDALYTNSTLAVQPNTGKLVWYHQHFPNDQWDLDWAFERQLVNLEIGGAPRRVLITAGKSGIYDALDARTGQFLFSIDLGLQNIVKAIDPVSGAKQVNTDLYPIDGKIKMVCPHGAGAKSYLPASWNQSSGVLVMPLNEACMDLYPVPGGGSVSALSSGVNWGIRPRPDSDGNYGRLEALDLATRKPLWTVRQHAPVSSGVLATAGGVVLAATYDRVLHVYDGATGRELWHSRLNDVSSSTPISYAVDGKQYVAAGVGTAPETMALTRMTPEFSPQSSNVIYVFALP